MIAVLDVGNSRIKWGLHPGDAPAAGRFIATGDCSPQALRGLVEPWLAGGGLQGIVWCSVAGETPVAALVQAAGRSGIAVRRVLAGECGAGVRNEYRNPVALGADRFAALAGARARADRASLVVDAGTAMTVDALLADGRFVGGMIVAGYRLMLEALARGTAELPRAEGRYAPFARETADAMVSGALQALAGAVERSLGALRALSGESAPALLLCGGDAPRLAPLLEMHSPQVVPSLVLEGLVLLQAEERPR